MSSNPTTAASCFLEIDDPRSKKEVLPEWIECYVLANIDPKCCGPLARDLNAILPLRGPTTLPSRASIADADAPPPPPSCVVADGPIADDVVVLPKTDHLKRIRRRLDATAADGTSSRSGFETVREQSTNNDDDDAAANRDGKKRSTNGDADAPNDEHPSKRPKKNKKRKKQNNASSLSLDVLVGSVAAVDHWTEGTGRCDSTPPSLSSILKRYNLSQQSQNFVRRSLPGRPARSKRELDQWNNSAWPTLFFEEKTVKYKEEQMELTREEVKMMKKGMNEALNDARVGRQQRKEWNITSHNKEETERMTPPVAGVVVMNPLDGAVVSGASEERRMQGMPERDGAGGGSTTKIRPWSSFPDDESNPLCTPTFLAIQGVSRRERGFALERGMESAEFRRGQYLCTRLDVYLTKEPSAYEAMALVHSRVRRVVFGVRDRDAGGLGGASAAGIHSLPGTNHHYRAFRLDAEGCSRDEGAAALVESLRELHGGDIV